jgi:hypothetical protein
LAKRLWADAIQIGGFVAFGHHGITAHHQRTRKLQSIVDFREVNGVCSSKQSCGHLYTQEAVDIRGKII